MTWGGTVDESTIGQTPLIELALDSTIDSTHRVFAKVEWFNLHQTPYGGGSVKSRIAKSMLDAAESNGELPGKTIIEPTSGNTGSELAKLGVSRGYNVEIVLPDNASGAKINTIRDAGAKIHFVGAEQGYDAVINRCREIIETDPSGYCHLDQYTNPANPRAHETTTAREVWSQTKGDITHFVAGVGTGGTITGAGRGLHATGDVRVIGVEPANPLHAIDGLKYLRHGDHYHPSVYDESVLDDKCYVETQAAYDRARALRTIHNKHPIRVHSPGRYDSSTIPKTLRVDGEFLVGTSSGACLEAASNIIHHQPADDPARIVLVFADRGDKYADIPLWEEHFGPNYYAEKPWTEN